MQFVNSGRFGLVINTRSQHGDHIKYANAFISNKKYGNLWTHVLNTRHAVISHEEYGNHHQICFEYYDDATICQRSCFLIFRKQSRTFLPQILWSICDSISLVCGLWAFRKSEVCDYLHFCFALIFHPCIETMFCGWCWHRAWIQTMICGQGSLFMRIDLVWNSIWTLDQRFCHPISTSKSTWISIKYMFAHCMYHHHCPNAGWHVVWIQYKRACSACDLSAILYAITAFIITIHHHPHPNCRHHHCHHHHLPHHHPSHRHHHCHHQHHPSTDCVNSIYASLLHAWPICPGRRRYLGAVIT